MEFKALQVTIGKKCKAKYECKGIDNAIDQKKHMAKSCVYPMFQRLQA